MHRAAVVVAATVGVALLLLGIALLVDRDADEPATPVLIDPAAGTFRGVALGDTKAQAVARLGAAPSWNGDQSVEPLDKDWDQIGPPSVMALDESADVLRYPHTTVELERGRVISIITAERGARTPGGVKIGDDLDSVRNAYPSLRCWEAPHAGGHGTYPVCSGRLSPDRWLWFGQDPIRSITLASRRLG